MTVYTLLLSDHGYNRPPLSLNDRMHWAAAGKIKRALADVVGWLAIGHQLPMNVDHATLTLAWNPAVHRSRDDDNPMASLKVCADALVRYGLVADDDIAHVTRKVEIGPVIPGGRLALLIEVNP
jgi:crossover junction endodeoxyribonuclease RusA